jgi:uncharacterized protein
MRAVVSGDFQGQWTGWQRFKSLILPEDVLIFTGDLFDTKYGDRQDQDFQPEALRSDFLDLPQAKHFVYGNCDQEFFLPGYPLFENFMFNGKQIFLTHGNTALYQPSNILREKKIDLYISGHTHVPELRKQGNTVLLNPGSLAKPRALKLTYALLESTSGGLKITLREYPDKILDQLAS